MSLLMLNRCMRSAATAAGAVCTRSSSTVLTSLSASASAAPLTRTPALGSIGSRRQAASQATSSSKNSSSAKTNDARLAAAANKAAASVKPSVSASASKPAGAAASTSPSSTPSSPNGKLGADGPNYWLTPSQIAAYHRDGYLSLEGFLSESELAPIEEVYDKFMRREIPVPGKDFCDMSATSFDIPFEQWNLVNAMLPTRYHPPLQGNLYEQRAASVIRQLFPGTAFGIDYDQLLAKKPSKKEAVFAWHADMAYWPMTSDTRTATFSLALDATTRANGCLRFVPGSHLTKTIRKHKPINSDRSKAHAIACAVGEDEPVVHLEVPRGGVTIHNEYVVHGSGGNMTDGWRRTYVCAFRTLDTIAQERAAGFTHSHNDTVNWDTFNQWDKQQQKE